MIDMTVRSPPTVLVPLALVQCGNTAAWLPAYAQTNSSPVQECALLHPLPAKGLSWLNSRCLA